MRPCSTPGPTYDALEVTVTLGPPARSITARTRPHWFGPEHSSQLSCTYLTELDPDLVQLPVHSSSSLVLVSLIFWLSLSFLMPLTFLFDHDTLVSSSYDLTSVSPRTMTEHRKCDEVIKAVEGFQMISVNQSVGDKYPGILSSSLQAGPRPSGPQQGNAPGPR
ncbi:hypothetical protein DY000_02022114 [Brassica cretica]|uniref:Uncharacterized protein n=1 Tax=Brassica cretica TaxID=69181 RepID=A0ABQ7E0B7_BRACR|nr:hypothetical protein DY000_02022114 [Brassica cretica]